MFKMWVRLHTWPSKKKQLEKGGLQLSGATCSLSCLATWWVLLGDP